MAFNHTALLNCVCLALLAVSLSTASNMQEWGVYNAQSVKVYDNIEWYTPKQNGIREGKFNFPTFVSFDKNIKAIAQM